MAKMRMRKIEEPLKTEVILALLDGLYDNDVAAALFYCRRQANWWAVYQIERGSDGSDHYTAAVEGKTYPEGTWQKRKENYRLPEYEMKPMSWLVHTDPATKKETHFDGDRDDYNRLPAEDRKHMQVRMRMTRVMTTATYGGRTDPRAIDFDVPVSYKAWFPEGRDKELMDPKTAVPDYYRRTTYLRKCRLFDHCMKVLGIDVGGRRYNDRGLRIRLIADLFQGKVKEPHYKFLLSEPDHVFRRILDLLVPGRSKAYRRASPSSSAP